MTSYADATYGAELRVDYAGRVGPIITLHDGTMLSVDGETLAFTSGSEYSDRDVRARARAIST